MMHTTDVLALTAVKLKASACCTRGNKTCEVELRRANNEQGFIIRCGYTEDHRADKLLKGNVSKKDPLSFKLQE